MKPAANFIFQTLLPIIKTTHHATRQKLDGETQNDQIHQSIQTLPQTQQLHILQSPNYSTPNLPSHSTISAPLPLLSSCTTINIKRRCTREVAGNSSVETTHGISACNVTHCAVHNARMQRAVACRGVCRTRLKNFMDGPRSGIQFS